MICYWWWHPLDVMGGGETQFPLLVLDFRNNSQCWYGHDSILGSALVTAS